MSESYAPRVGVILVNYNGAKDTMECVRSLAKITYPNYEVIIVDNASTDDSVEMLQSVELPNNVALLTAPENLGFSGGNNIGIRYALSHGADYILLLNNDTLVEESFLNCLVDSAQKLDSQTILTSKILYADEPDTIWYAGGEFDERIGRVSHTRIGQKNNVEEALREVTFVSGCCMLLSADAVKQIGEMDESFFLYCEDLEYCCRAREKGFRLYYEPRSVIYHKVSASTGRSSDLAVYYTVRNMQHIIDGYVPAGNRMLAKGFYFAQVCKRLLSGEYSLPAVHRACSDNREGKTGKQELSARRTNDPAHARYVTLCLILFYILNKNLVDIVTFGISKIPYYSVILIAAILGMYGLFKNRDTRSVAIAFCVYGAVVLSNGLLLSNMDQLKWGIKSYLTYPIVFFALIYLMQGRKDCLSLLRGITVWGAITSVLGCIEFAIGKSILPGFNGVVYHFENGMMQYRATVFIGSPMVLGILLGFALILCFYFFQREKKWRYVFFAILLLAGLLSTGSRAPLLMCILGITVVGLQFLRQGTLPKIILYIGLGGVAACVLFFGVFIICPELSTGIEKLDFLIYRVISSFNFSTEWGNVARLQIWSYYLERFVESPLFGYGIGTASAEVASNASIAFSGFYAINPESGLLARLAETGILGTVAYAAFLYLIIVKSLKTAILNPKKEKNSELFAFVGVLVMIGAEDILLQISLDIFCVFIQSFVLAYALTIRYGTEVWLPTPQWVVQIVRQFCGGVRTAIHGCVEAITKRANRS